MTRTVTRHRHSTSVRPTAVTPSVETAIHSSHNHNHNLNTILTRARSSLPRRICNISRWRRHTSLPHTPPCHRRTARRHRRHRRRRTYGRRACTSLRLTSLRRMRTSRRRLGRACPRHHSLRTRTARLCTTTRRPNLLDSGIRSVSRVVLWRVVWWVTYTRCHDRCTMGHCGYKFVAVWTTFFFVYLLALLCNDGHLFTT